MSFLFPWFCHYMSPWQQEGNFLGTILSSLVFVSFLPLTKYRQFTLVVEKKKILMVIVKATTNTFLK